MFGRIGAVSSIKLVSSAKLSRVSAFVCYDDSAAAQTAIKQLDGFDLFGSGDLLQVCWFQKKGDRERLLRKELFQSKAQNNLYVKGILDTVSAEQLKAAFESYGAISMHDLKRPADNKISSQYGFIAFKKEREAIRAKEESGENPAIQALFVGEKPYV